MITIKTSKGDIKLELFEKEAPETVKNFLSYVVLMVKNPSANARDETQETQVRPQGQEDPLEKEMTTGSSILAWKISRTESIMGYSGRCHKELDTTE